MKRQFYQRALALLGIASLAIVLYGCCGAEFPVTGKGSANIKEGRVSPSDLEKKLARAAAEADATGKAKCPQPSDKPEYTKLVTVKFSPDVSTSYSVDGEMVTCTVEGTFKCCKP